VRFYFFFQAEDGIRDKLVTGVQTCALPILSNSALTGRGGDEAPRWPAKTAGLVLAGATIGVVWLSEILVNSVEPVIAASGLSERSEERRVGKECRCGWGE